MSSSSFLGVGLGLAGLFAAFAKDDMMPPESPRLSEGVPAFPVVEAGVAALAVSLGSSWMGFEVVDLDCVEAGYCLTGFAGGAAG